MRVRRMVWAVLGRSLKPHRPAGGPRAACGGRGAGWASQLHSGRGRAYAAPARGRQHRGRRHARAAQRIASSRSESAASDPRGDGHSAGGAN
jgi:hypothetical protein